MPGGKVTGLKAQTHVEVKWKILPPEQRDAAGVRYIEGIAYNAAIKGQRRRVTCSLDVWCNPNEDVFYGDESVRWTESELRELNLEDIPLKPLHHPKLPPIGRVVGNWVDPSGNLHIMGELDGTSTYGKQMISYLDSGACHELSIGYELWRDDVTGEVSRLGVKEISMVPIAHFRGCKVNIQASKSDGDAAATPALPYTIFEAVREALTSKDSDPPFSAVDMQTNNNSNAAALGSEPAPPGMPTELIANYSRLQANYKASQEREAALAADLEKKTKEAEKLAKRQAEIDAAAEAAREQHVRKEKPVADEIISKLEAIVKEEGLVGVSDEWKQVEGNILTDPAPLSQEIKAVTVACMRKIAKTEDLLTAAQTELTALKAERRVAMEMTTVDDAERGERREVKAGRRLMADDTAEDTAPRGRSSLPAWYDQVMGQKVGGMYVPPAMRTYTPAVAVPQERSVLAGRNPLPTPPAQAQIQVPQQQQQEAPRRTHYDPLARYGAPPSSNFAGVTNPEFDQHFKDVMHTTPLDNALWTFAGHDFNGPSANVRQGF